MSMANEARRKFGANVRRVRKSMGLSQEALADESGIHRTYIGSVERGERNISLDNILAIARALKVSPAELLLEVDEC